MLAVVTAALVDVIDTVVAVLAAVVAVVGLVLVSGNSLQVHVALHFLSPHHQFSIKRDMRI